MANNKMKQPSKRVSDIAWEISERFLPTETFSITINAELWNVVVDILEAERASLPESIKLTLQYYEAAYPELNAKFAIEDLCNWREGK